MSGARTKIGFMGLGTMGMPMAEAVGRAGYSLAVWNRTASRSQVLSETVGASIAASPGELTSDVDVILTMISDGASLRDLYFREDGVLGAMRPGTICVDMSTVGPGVARELSGEVAARGGSFVDAPVSGSVSMAQSATLTTMVGGNEDVVGDVYPVLSAMATKVIHVGPVGAGATLKLAINSIVFGLSGALAEALVLCERSGIEPDVAYGVIAESAAGAPFVHYRKSAFLTPDDVPVAFPMGLATKDLDLALELAETVHAPMPQARTNRDLFRAAIASGFGELDMSGVTQFLRLSDERRN